MRCFATIQQLAGLSLLGSEQPSKEASQESARSYGRVLNAQRMTAHSSILIRLAILLLIATIETIAIGKSLSDTLQRSTDIHFNKQHNRRLT